MWSKIRSNFMLERMIIFGYLFSSISGLQYTIQRGTEFHFYTTFYSIRVAIIVLAFSVNIILKFRMAYLPILSEMPEKLYWTYTGLIIFLMRLVVLEKFIQLSNSALLLDLSIAATLIVSLMINIQSQNWARRPLNEYERRLEKLRKKAKLSKKEVELITGDLLENYSKKDRKKFVLATLQIILGVVIAVTIETQADFIVELLGQFGIHFPNVLPPF